MAKNQGKQPIFTRKDLIALISPLVVEQILTVTMGLADTYMVAGVGEAAVSSVSLVDSLNILILQILSALATGGAVVCGQYLGRRDEKRAKKMCSAAVFCPDGQHDSCDAGSHVYEQTDLARCVWKY